MIDFLSALADSCFSLREELMAGLPELSFSIPESWTGMLDLASKLFQTAWTYSVLAVCSLIRFFQN